MSLTLRFGSSLRLMADCSAFLNNSEEFNEVDPEGDWEKWCTRVPGAFTLFYAAIVDPLQSGHQAVHCVLRAVLDGWPTPRPPHRTRLIIDYVACRTSQRGRGHASRLVNHVRQACLDADANCYVLALEESCPWWMDKGFVLEQGEQLNARLNVFPDVHCLRVHDDPPDEGSPDDLALLEEEEDDDEQEGGEQQAEGGGGEAAAAAASDNDHGDAKDVGGGDDDVELQTALALSLAPTAKNSLSDGPGAYAAAVAAGTDMTAVEAAAKAEPAADEDEEERAMQEAIALSLS